MPQRVPISPQWRTNFCWVAVSGGIISIVSVCSEITIFAVLVKRPLQSPRSEDLRRGAEKRSQPPQESSALCSKGPKPSCVGCDKLRRLFNPAEKSCSNSRCHPGG